MPILQITGPALEPVTLDELKRWLRIDGTDDDQVLTALITVARLGVEAASGCKLVNQAWRLVLDAWPQSPFELPIAPVSAVTAVRVFNAADVAATLPTTAVRLASAPRPRLALVGPVQQPGRSMAGIEIDVTAGYGATAAAVPASLRMAVQLFAARLFEHRGDGPENEPVPLPPAAAALIAPFRQRRL